MIGEIFELNKHIKEITNSMVILNETLKNSISILEEMNERIKKLEKEIQQNKSKKP